MPNWLKYLVGLLGIGAKELVAVKTGTGSGTAITEGITEAAPLVDAIIAEATPKPKA